MRSTFWTRRKRASRWTSNPTPDDSVAVGRIAGAFGIAGELKCDPTESGRDTLEADRRYACVRGDLRDEVLVESVRRHGNRLLLKFAGVETPEAARAYSGATLYAPRAEVSLAPGEYFASDLIGCAVVGADGREYGTVEAVRPYPASDMLIVNGAMVPMVAAIVRTIDVAGKRIEIDPPAGLFD